MTPKGISKVIWLLRQLRLNNGKFRAVINDSRVIRYLELLGYKLSDQGTSFTKNGYLTWYKIERGAPVAPWAED